VVPAADEHRTAVEGTSFNGADPYASTMVASETPTELHERLEEDDVQVVDIRPERAFREGHIPGALNLPFPQLPQRVEDVEWGDDIVVACPKGESSLQAARMLESYEGVDAEARVANLEGGYREWRYELVDGRDEKASETGAEEGPDAPF
jgi:rhodanese-related sulfurtransferase